MRCSERPAQNKRKVSRTRLQQEGEQFDGTKQIFSLKSAKSTNLGLDPGKSAWTEVVEFLDGQGLDWRREKE